MSADHAINGRIGAHISWARTPTKAARTRRTEPGREGLLAKFGREVDPDGVMSPEDRDRAAEHLRSAHMSRIAKISAANRAAKKNRGRA